MKRMQQEEEREKNEEERGIKREYKKPSERKR